mgnify:CR=1 FL=1
MYDDSEIDALAELEFHAKGAAHAMRATGNEGFADKLEKMAEWMRKLKHNICGQGYIGCTGGEDCTSDHK